MKPKDFYIIKPAPTSGPGVSGEGEAGVNPDANMRKKPTRMEDAEARIDHSETRIGQAETRIDHAELRIECAEILIEEAATLSQEASTQMEQAAIQTQQAATATEQAATATQQAEAQTQEGEIQTQQAETQTQEADLRTDQAETRTHEANARTKQAEARTLQANTRTDQANTRTEQANSRTEQANTRTDQANTRTEQAEARSVQAILASELQYRRLFETAQDGILILDAKTGQVVDANPFMKDLLGYSQEEFLGKKLWEIGPFKGTGASKIAFAELQLKDRIHYEGLPLETKDGLRVEVEFISNAYLMDEKRLIQCNIRNITERRKADDALRSSELRYRRLFEAAQDGVLILECKTGRITDVNPYLAKLLNFSIGEMIGKTVAELSPFKDIESNLDMLERLQRDGFVRYDDLPLETRDGRRIAVEFVCNVYEVGERNVIQCNIRDITERKTAEMVSLRLAAIIESSNDAIIGKDLDSVITSWNKGAEKLFGYTASEMVGSSISRLIPDDRQGEEDQILEKIGRGENILPFETVRHTKDGRLIDVSITASPIKDVSGKAVGASKVARDISQRKAAAEKILQLNAELEQRVVERTTQLQDANKELQAFSYSVSHDLRAPVRHVLGFVDLLVRGAGPTLSEKNLRHLTMISDSANRMGNLIDDLLAFSRVGRAELKKADVSLDDLVRETLGDFQEETKGRKIDWEIHPLPVVRADRALLRMVLVNLISNAVKFTSHRTEAKIEIGSPPNGNSETIIFIRDNGAGFDPKYTEKLFGVFQRLHGQDEFEGTGIGLANVQRIICRHGGRVWAEGAVDDGATFFFSIPKQ